MIRPKKRLGQNFLNNPDVIKRITDACDFSPDEDVVEIGAGTGAMTSRIAPLVRSLAAVEIDRTLLSALQGYVKDYANVRCIHGDIRKISLEDLARQQGRPGGIFKIFGNIPYYITSEIIIGLLKQRQHISSIYLTVQKEVGLRLAAKPGTKAYGPLSIHAQFYAKVKLLFTISRGHFRPQPAVDSALVRLEVLPRPSVSVKDEELFFRVTRAAFTQRRKTILNALTTEMLSRSRVQEILETLGIDPRRRPGDLGLEDFANIINLIS